MTFKCSTENIKYSDNSKFEPRVEVALIIRGVRLVCSVVINMKSNADQEDADVYLGRTDWKKFRELSSLEFEETPPVPYSKELSARDEHRRREIKERGEREAKRDERERDERDEKRRRHF